MTYSTIDKGDPHFLVSIKCFCFHLMCVAAAMDAKSNMNTQKLILKKISNTHRNVHGMEFPLCC